MGKYWKSRYSIKSSGAEKQQHSDQSQTHKRAIQRYAIQISTEQQNIKRLCLPIKGDEVTGTNKNTSKHIFQQHLKSEIHVTIP